METNKKKCTVVMLATNEKASFNYGQLCIDTKGYYKDKLCIIHEPNLNRMKPQHLYIISDDEIKEGDWCINEPYGVHRYSNNIGNRDIGYTMFDTYKIIATTDTSLIIEKEYDSIHLGKQTTYRSLPQPSQAFIQKYVEEFNKGNIISDVMVEYNHFRHTTPVGTCYDESFELKVDSHNTITITRVKDSWSRDEMVELIQKAWSEAELRYGDFSSSKERSNQWIEENL